MNGAEEYKNLYQEIGRNSQISQNVFVANVAVTATLIGFGLTQKIGAIFFAPFAILVPSLFFVASQLESTTRIAAYLVVFFENNSTELHWETRWLALREKDLLPAKRKYTLAVSSLYGLLGAACLILAFYYRQFSIEWYLAIATPIILAVIAGVMAVVSSFSLSRVHAYIAAWEQLKEQSVHDVPPNSAIKRNGA